MSERNGKLPFGWAQAKLEELVYFAGRIGWRGLKAKEYTESGPLLLSVYNLNKGNNVDFTDANHVSWDRYEESPEIKLQENDILLAKDGAGIGKLGIVKDLPCEATINSSLLLIRALETFDPKYL
jgi:type I restriction enzyme S subunit